MARSESDLQSTSEHTGAVTASGQTPSVLRRPFRVSRAGTLTLFLLAALLLAGPLITSGYADPPETEEEKPEDGLKVTVETDKEEYFLGENVLLRWHAQNTEGPPLKISVGGDGRTPGARRAVRFKIEAISSDGVEAADPWPNPANHGGMGGDPELKAGEEGYWKDLQLMRYRHIVDPGQYTISVYHDLGMAKGERWHRTGESSIPEAPFVPPLAKTKIRFVMPNEEQARQVVKAMLNLGKDPGAVWGKKRALFADFEMLHYPVYLPIMLELVNEGDHRGLDAISWMAFPEATAALFELTENADKEIAVKATDLLLKRSAFNYNRRPSPKPSRRSYLWDNSWNEELKLKVGALGWKLLATDDRESWIRGARLINGHGTKEELPHLIKVMDHILVQLKDHEVEQQAYRHLRPGSASDALLRAAGTLLSRGAKLPESTDSPGKAIVWLSAFSSDKDFRPDRWQETARELISHPIPFIRCIGLRSHPDQVDQATELLVASAISDGPVQAAACDLAFRAKAQTCNQAIETALKNTQDKLVFGAAFRAGKELGIENDRLWEISVDRLKSRDDKWNTFLIDHLRHEAMLTSGRGLLSSGRRFEGVENWSPFLRKLQTAWKTFIEENRAQIRAGEKLSKDKVTPDMLPPGYKIRG